jgi:hypothetical protein
MKTETYDPIDHEITTVRLIITNADSPETASITRLIAAAPDLLEACRAWMAYHDTVGEPQNIRTSLFLLALDKTKAAIKLAEKGE